jgi:GNAT superfamily N-acetyltransferase
MPTRRLPSRDASTRGVAGGSSRAVEVVELTPEEHAVAREVFIRKSRGANAETAQQLIELDRRLEAAVPTRNSGVRVGGVPVAYASISVNRDVAQIEDVKTYESYRRRGYASAVVLRAVREAHAAGAGTVFLPTAEDDWPQHLYRRLGFETVAVEAMFGPRGIGPQQRYRCRCRCDPPCRTPASYRS